MNKRQHLFALISILCVFCLFIAFSCGKDSEEEDYYDDTFGPGYGGSGGGGDDDDDDNDDNDDDTSSDKPYVAVIHGDSDLTLQDFESFLTAYGIDGEFIAESAIISNEFSGFEAIVVMPSCNFYESNQWQTISNSDKNVVGMHYGGAILFGKLDLWANLGNGYGYDSNRITATLANDRIWSNPYGVSLDSNNVVTIASFTIGLYGHSDTAMPTNVINFADVYGNQGRSVISLQASKYLFFGLEFLPEVWEKNAYAILANCIYYMAGY